MKARDNQYLLVDLEYNILPNSRGCQIEFETQDDSFDYLLETYPDEDVEEFLIVHREEV